MSQGVLGSEGLTATLGSEYFLLVTNVRLPSGSRGWRRLRGVEKTQWVLRVHWDRDFPLLRLVHGCCFSTLCRGPLREGVEGRGGGGFGGMVGVYGIPLLSPRYAPEYGPLPFVVGWLSWPPRMPPRFLMSFTRWLLSWLGCDLASGRGRRLRAVRPMRLTP